MLIIIYVILGRGPIIDTNGSICPTSFRTLTKCGLPASDRTAQTAAESVLGKMEAKQK
jgi:hypothetical protein